MNRLLIVLAFLALLLGVSGSRAEAQVATPYGTWVNRGGVPTFTPVYVPSYSYWTAAYYGYPPRLYIGLNAPADDFPYYGRPYGSPSDPWSWPAMAGYPNGVPTRYYLVLP
jgi:hypothetical protein